MTALHEHPVHACTSIRLVIVRVAFGDAIVGPAAKSAQHAQCGGQSMGCSPVNPYQSPKHWIWICA
ncbi:MAG: hypothetical protein KGL42_17660 [Betaproteobacteria bacterium]|nr:hypothetical protein [Betaproteobacteria bacterium]